MKPLDPFDIGGGEDVLKLVSEVQGWVDSLAGVMRELEEQELTGADETGRVVATVSGSGRLLHLAIAPPAMRDLDHVAIGQAIQDAIGAARAAMGEALTQTMETLSDGRPWPAEDPFASYFDMILKET
ncbi:YbaB/EbfC family nucleoid-associated protein [Nonomuraea sp. LPB2021202275-12-8]|uniref:YbaB/EbfC family nucleoid-associated protein n=1 Tax=Nonomuraea sp. LPB2021202275-12-8 TaxID=3120159 RepID=UPI00300CFB05